MDSVPSEDGDGGPQSKSKVEEVTVLGERYVCCWP